MEIEAEGPVDIHSAMDCSESSNGFDADRIEGKEKLNEDAEINAELDENDDLIVDLKQRIQTLCEQKLPNGAFTPSSQTVTVWKTVFSIAYDYPSILNHPDLSAIHQLFLLLGIRLHGNDFDITIPINNQPLQETKDPANGTTAKELALHETNNIEGNGTSTSTTSETGVHPVQLMIGHIEDLEYDPESRMVTIRKYSMTPGIKQHVNQILVFLLTQPNQLYGRSCEFITDFLTHFGVKDTDVTRFVGLVSKLNETKENYSRTHYAIKSWLRQNPDPWVAKLEKELPEPNYIENNEGRDYWLEWLHKTCVQRLNKAKTTKSRFKDAERRCSNGTAQHLKSSHNSYSKSKPDSRRSSGVTDSASDEDGSGSSSSFGKGKHKKRQRWMHKRMRHHHLTSGVPLSFHPGSRFRDGSVNDVRRHSMDSNSRLSRLRTDVDRPNRYIASDYNRRKTDNDKKPFGCPSSTGCPVRFLYKFTMLKHFNLKHPNEILPSGSSNGQTRSGEFAVPALRIDANGTGTPVPTSPQKRHRYSVENEKKPFGCPSATGCPVRFLYETTMMKHFREKHSKEVLPPSGLLSAISAAVVPVKREESSRSLRNMHVNGPSTSSSVKVKEEKDHPPKEKEPEPLPRASGEKSYQSNSNENGQQAKPIACASGTGCTVTFMKRKNMLKHFRRMHPDEPVPYLTTSSRFKTGHTGPVPPQANTNFNTKKAKRPKCKSALVGGKFVRMRKDNEKKPLGCPSKTGCPVRFKYRVTMQRHLRAQHPDEAKLQGH